MKKKNNTTTIILVSIVILAIAYFAYVNQNIAGQAAFRNQNVEAPQGNIIASGYLKGSQLCIGTDCRSSWPSAGAESQWTTSGSNIYYSTGRIGVGTASPATLLNVQGAGTAANGIVDMVDTGSSGAYFRIVENGYKGWAIGIDNSQKALNFRENSPTGSIRMTLLEGGNLGIGTTSPTQKLDVAGNVKATGLCIGNDCKTAWPSALTCTTRMAASTGGSTVQTKIITCDAGETVYGGGCYGVLTGGPSYASVAASFPGDGSTQYPVTNMNKWTCVMTASHTQYFVNAYAICCK